MLCTSKANKQVASALLAVRMQVSCCCLLSSELRCLCLRVPELCLRYMLLCTMPARTAMRISISEFNLRITSWRQVWRLVATNVFVHPCSGKLC